MPRCVGVGLCRRNTRLAFRRPLDGLTRLLRLALDRLDRLAIIRARDRIARCGLAIRAQSNHGAGQRQHVVRNRPRTVRDRVALLGQLVDALGRRVHRRLKFVFVAFGRIPAARFKLIGLFLCRLDLLLNLGALRQLLAGQWCPDRLDAVMRRAIVRGLKIAVDPRARAFADNLARRLLHDVVCQLLEQLRIKDEHATVCAEQVAFGHTARLLVRIDADQLDHGVTAGSTVRSAQLAAVPAHASSRLSRPSKPRAAPRCRL